jgi:hypothetical protein
MMDASVSTMMLVYISVRLGDPINPSTKAWYPILWVYYADILSLAIIGNRFIGFTSVG